ncbi:hypothetical protein E3N88_10030 [Mikania micrantha]|uniref:Phospholipase-like protein n=1 Tax=Mikania micrantha TaxID=192012 RepID=A0A5N6PAN0_9ASTR|nr:hypothetical protein E3N88_10030 [Mikania micrantha]
MLMKMLRCLKKIDACERFTVQDTNQKSTLQIEVTENHAKSAPKETINNSITIARHLKSKNPRSNGVKSSSSNCICVVWNLDMKMQTQKKEAKYWAGFKKLIDKNWGNTKERDWRNTMTLINLVKDTTELLLDDDSDVEVFDLKQEECELVENVSPMLASLEKFSSLHSGMICVRGYKVKQSNAPILEAIFKKHGDIAAECVFKTNSVRSSILEVVCEVVKQIQTNEFVGKMDEIDRQMSDAKAANIDVSWLQAHLEAIHISNKYNLLMEMKSNTILVNRAAQMDLRERRADLVAALQQFQQAERCVRVLHLVEKNLNDNILESKAIIDSWEQSKRSVATTKVRQSGKEFTLN